MRHYHGHHGWFHGGYWNRCNNLRWRFPNNCWRWATWGTVASWLPWGWSEPAYYDYGSTVYYEGDTVYYGDEPYATAEEYADQAAAIAESVPQDIEPDKVEWLPLGVFALTQDGPPNDADPTIFIQLAVSKEGIIGGTIQDTTTDKVEAIEGMVDKESQRAAWTVVGKSHPIMETGINNLTNDEVPALLHFADGQTQQWLLIRLEEPKKEEPK